MQKLYQWKLEKGTISLHLPDWFSVDGIGMMASKSGLNSESEYNIRFSIRGSEAYVKHIYQDFVNICFIYPKTPKYRFLEPATENR